MHSINNDQNIFGIPTTLLSSQEEIQSNMYLIYNFDFSNPKFSCLWDKRAGISKFFLSVFNLSIDLTWAVDDLQETEPARTLKPFLPNLLIGKKQCAADKIVLLKNVSKNSWDYSLNKSQPIEHNDV